MKCPTDPMNERGAESGPGKSSHGSVLDSHGMLVVFTAPHTLVVFTAPHGLFLLNSKYFGGKEALLHLLNPDNSH
jgi:hypothetical protein